jgi:hypothetical protein
VRDEVAMAVPMGTAAKAAAFGCFKRCATSFRVAGMALRDILTCLKKYRKVILCDNHKTFARFSEDELHSFLWQAEHFDPKSLPFGMDIY